MVKLPLQLNLGVRWPYAIEVRMTRVRVVTSQVCAYCLERFEQTMVPMSFASRAHGNSQVWLHPRCAARAFDGARAGFDIADMTVDIDVPPDGEGWTVIPDEE